VEEMINRDRHDIAIEILKKATSGKSKTELMRDVGLSYLQAKQYLAMLSDNGLLKIEENHRFKTTSKGLEFLEKCKECLLFNWCKQKK
jgi:predicted transcriptional regulator